MKNTGQNIKTYKCFLTVAMTVKLGRIDSATILS